MTAVDSSVVVAALVSWHEAHEVSARVAAGSSIPAHALFESYSVLTRLPAPNRLDPATALTLLDAWFPLDRQLTLDGPRARSALRELAKSGIGGGATYDGLIAITARDNGQTLVSRDVRAVATYSALGAPHRLVAS